MALSVKKVERVYVGGLDPQKLPGNEALDRLQESLADDVEILDPYVGSCFFQFNCISKKENVSALEIVAKLYNNVKWKGCRLRVEAARPHFLERLKQEIAERNQEAPVLSEAKQDANPINNDIVSRRHLKIRRGYGEESWRVDTRPVAVTDWKTFNKQRDRLAKKRKLDPAPRGRKEVLEMISAARKAHWNRSIHLRFVDDELSNVQNNGAEIEEEPVEMFSSSPSSSSASDDTDSSSATASSVSSSSSSSGSTSPTNIQGETLPKEFNPFVWSEDENEMGLTETRLREVSNNDEFAAAITDFETTVENGDPISDAVEPGNIDDDVQANLDILGSIFPDMKATNPVQVEEDDEKDVSSKSGPGWHAGQMVRFDPTKVSASQFLRKEEYPTPTEQQEAPVVKEKEQTPIPRQVYEEGKLEEVFREAREADQVESTDQDAGFSFGFNLGASPTVQEPIRHSSEDLLVSSAPDKAIPATEVQDAEAETEIIPRRGMEGFSRADIETYYMALLKTGAGAQILSDPEGYRNDERVKDAWNSDRKRLTADWKRKKKYAQSRKNYMTKGQAS